MLALSIIHNLAFIMETAFWAATLAVAAVFVKTAPSCDLIQFKIFNSNMVKLATIAFAVVVLSTIINVSLLQSASLAFLVAIFTYELLMFIDPLRSWRDSYVC